MHHKTQSLKETGFYNLRHVHWNHTTANLLEHAIQRREGLLAQQGPLVVRTGQYTGRSPHDKYIVDEPSSSDRVWWGKVNQSISSEVYEHLRSRVLTYFQDRDVYVQELYAGANPKYRISLRLVSESAWHALFARTMFIREADRSKLDQFVPDYTIIHAPHFHAAPEEDGTRSEVFVILNFGRKEILIGGTQYGGEIKKSIFTLMNYLLPLKGILSMHCSANVGEQNGDTALFFGLSGTGKTSLSIDTARVLVGDDEHGWGDDGIFNVEGGCYAKVIKISKEYEPEIFCSSQMFGAIMENVTIDSVTREIDFDDDSLTENTRAAFPISYLPNAAKTGISGHPEFIFYLTADAFGVLPPIAKLTPDQAIYYFLLAYTAKVAGTECGIKDPEATFSPCFGAPFMVHPPVVYAEMLGERIRKHGSTVWLVNTGWTGGAYGVGERISLPYTRSMVHAVLERKLEKTAFKTDPFFGLHLPVEVPGVPRDVLRPKNTWKDKDAYDRAAVELTRRFREAFKEFETAVPASVKDSGPR
ncbi:MAG: phosphoenolpyruvate carboxykinase (ATP) [Deltaproteobacteria bacterium]|nr:phosphoenolpyruvate carboxykinase (ATP) [Deltaproteobacteria bacterium]NIS76770.1 phosphoenolpyruvate carboxykinase (ATP) [Deltaproteobacteria bacterium]